MKTGMNMKHMKKALCLTLVLALCLPLAAAAEGFDLSPVQALTDYFTIDVDTEANAAFVETQLTAADRSFVHEFENDIYYSSTQFDLLAVHYNEPDCYPVFRLWIDYWAYDFLKIDSVTFELDGVKYTFSGVSKDEWRTSHGSEGINESLLIKFGMENIAFPAALEHAMNSIDNDLDRVGELNITLTLHGTTDVTVRLGDGFWVDFAAMKLAWSLSGGMTTEYLRKANSTEMTQH